MVGTYNEFDAALELCTDAHRRIVLAELIDHQESLSIDRLVDAIVEHNHHVDPASVSGETTNRIEISLVHAHLPKLADAGFVEYDTDDWQVMPTERFDRTAPAIASILQIDPEFESSFSL
ncbi:DUF7344 domain-containing protein [Halovivax cerinus]|uniref:DUF7344 domain-containing protein n=1 Tax=Halovivax cerinus TaxID=1487865 RepID=A0ABD5NU40_9EURY|nr:hypothetical protein [Halovivax cerinus]